VCGLRRDSGGATHIDMRSDPPPLVYRLAVPSRWAEAMQAGKFTGEADDVRDGFIHFSTADQLPGTLEKHYSGHDRLALVEVPVSELGDALKWETSRGGDLFPHLYGDLPMLAVATVRLIRRGEDGEWTLPSEIFE